MGAIDKAKSTAKRSRSQTVVGKRPRPAGPVRASQPTLAMDVRQLRYFVGVAEDLHFGRAAERLHVSQPALSRQVQHLESQLGARLLERDQRTVKLTMAGSALLHQARRILAMTERAQRIVHSVSERHSDELRIGFSEPLNSYVNSVVLRGLAERYPAVRPQLRPMSSAEQLTALRYKQLDIALVWDVAGAHQSNGSLERMDVMQDDIDLVVSPTNELALTDHVDRQDLVTQQFLMFPRRENPDLFDWFIGVLRSWGVLREPLIADSSGLLGLVTAGIGVTFTSRRAARILRTHLVVRSLADAHLRVSAQFIWRRWDKSQPLQRFIEIARAARDSGRWSDAAARGVGAPGSSN